MRLDAGPVVEVHPRSAEPLVVRPEQLPGEDGSRPQRVTDVRPQVRKMRLGSQNGSAKPA